MSKKINYSKFVGIIAENNKVEEIHLGNGGNEIIIEVKPHISYSKSMEIVSNVTDLCFPGNEYHPEIFEFAFYAQIAKYYTNIDCEIAIDRLWSLLNDTGLIGRLWDAIKDDLYVLQQNCKDSVEVRVKEEYMSWTDILAKRLVNLLDSVDGLAELNKLYAEDSDVASLELLGGDGK